MKRTLLALAVVALPFSLAAQNPVQNPGFTSSLTGWSTWGPVVWSPIDASGSGSSGSVRTTHDGSPNAPGQVTQCIQLSPGTYEYKARVMVPAQAQSGFTVNRLWTYEQPDCTGQNGFNEVFAMHGENLTPNTWSTVKAWARIPPGVTSALVQGFVQSNNNNAPNFTGHLDDFSVLPTDEVLLLGEGARFQFEVTWETKEGVTGRGHGVMLTRDSGYFWFFAASNIELVVKAVRGCGFNQKMWIFMGGLTDVKVDVKVTDRYRDQVKIYTSTLGEPFAPVRDTGTYPCL